MKHRFEGYRWMWGALRRWRGGPVWRRAFSFLGLVFRDLVPASRRAIGLTGAVALAVVAVTVLWPSFSAYRFRHVEIGVYSDGIVQVDGEVTQVSALKDFLSQYPVRTATVGVEADVTFIAVHQVQAALVENGIRLARFERLEES